MDPEVNGWVTGVGPGLPNGNVDLGSSVFPPALLTDVVWAGFGGPNEKDGVGAVCEDDWEVNPSGDGFTGAVMLCAGVVWNVGAAAGVCDPLFPKKFGIFAVVGALVVGVFFAGCARLGAENDKDGAGAEL